MKKKIQCFTSRCITGGNREAEGRQALLLGKSQNHMVCQRTVNYSLLYISHKKEQNYLAFQPTLSISLALLRKYKYMNTYHFAMCLLIPDHLVLWFVCLVVDSISAKNSYKKL